MQTRIIQIPLTLGTSINVTVKQLTNVDKNTKSIFTLLNTVVTSSHRSKCKKTEYKQKQKVFSKEYTRYSK